uniref:Uncharacterized protein n=1 Tax=Leersia perrieri TaxID=77586 RepID=A0A0D9VGX0_9ORYZ
MADRFSKATGYGSSLTLDPLRMLQIGILRVMLDLVMASRDDDSGRDLRADDSYGFDRNSGVFTFAQTEQGFQPNKDKNFKDGKEKEALLEEIQDLKNQLHYMLLLSMALCRPPVDYYRQLTLSQIVQPFEFWKKLVMMATSMLRLLRVVDYSCKKA